MDLNDEQYHLLSSIDELLHHGHHDLVDAMLQSANVPEMSSMKLMTLLSATMPASHLLPNREAFYSRCWVQFMKSGKDASLHLSGLR